MAGDRTMASVTALEFWQGWQNDQSINKYWACDKEEETDNEFNFGHSGS